MQTEGQDGWGGGYAGKAPCRGKAITLSQAAPCWGAMLCQGPRLQTLKITEAWLKGKRGWLTRSKGSGVNWESPGPPPNSGWHILMEARNLDFFVFLGPHPRHMESPRLGVKSELQLPATATRDLSCICDLHHILRQCQILSPLSEARDPTCVFMDASQFPFLLSLNRNSRSRFFKLFLIEVELTYDTVLISVVQQNDSVIHIYTHMYYTYIYMFFFNSLPL